MLGVRARVGRAVEYQGRNDFRSKAPLVQFQDLVGRRFPLRDSGSQSHHEMELGKRIRGSAARDEGLSVAEHRAGGTEMISAGSAGRRPAGTEMRAGRPRSHERALLLFAMLILAPLAHAHDPFEIWTLATLQRESLQVEVTMAKV